MRCLSTLYQILISKSLIKQVIFRYKYIFFKIKYIFSIIYTNKTIYYDV